MVRKKLYGANKYLTAVQQENKGFKKRRCLLWIEKKLLDDITIKFQHFYACKKFNIVKY